MSLFPSTFDFAIAALNAFDFPLPNLNVSETERSIELQLPEELKPRYDRLPKEIRPDEKTLLSLTDNPREIMAAMVEARRQDDRWPVKQYLWEFHPLVEWLGDRCLFHFGCHQAPMVQLAEGMAPGEAIFICFGSFPNRRGATVLNRWVSVIFNKNLL
ncbi:hypothetical protein ACL6C3_14990 [Capilliphycus salinus ALCB114379]|uniref:hypothetical protein n=1 Tax=Capilliphycus salinus TaxID=2768948 RepID=UPI0039A6ACC4